MQEAVDLHVSTTQKLMTEKLELEQHHQAERKKAEDVRPSIISYTRPFNAFVSQDWLEMGRSSQAHREI